VFSLCLPWIIRATGAYLWIFFVPGFLLGIQFPLASKIYIKGKEEEGEAAGVLYAADLIGGCVAGILGGIVFLPVLGLVGTCLVMVILKVSSLVLLLVERRG
jgi:spermidine synthase